MTVSGSDTVSKAAFALCRQVVAAGTRPRVQALLNDLHISEYGDGRHGRGGFGYYASKLGGQFAGYVALDSVRPRLNPTIGALPPITDEERALLVQAHREIVALNAACVGGLAGLQPGLSEAVDPYSGVPADTLRPAESAMPLQDVLLNEAFVRRAADAFQGSALCEGVSRVPSEIRNAFGPAKLKAVVEQLDKTIRSPDVGKHSDELTAIAFQTPHQFPPRIALTYQAALVGVRSALRILDQLVFQAFQVDRLPAVNSDNLIDIKGPSSSVAERVVLVTIQPTLEIAHPKPGEVVFLEHPHLPKSFHGLAEIVGTRYQMSRETGSLINLTLHLVDDNLNPSPLYHSLAREN